MKGQAAIEYLMTYGWAIVLLIVALAFLLSSGFFTPSQFVKERCTVVPDLPCLSTQLINEKNGVSLKLRLRNDFGYRIKVGELIFYTEDIGVNGRGKWKLDVNKVVDQGDDVVIIFTFRGNTLPKPGEMKKITFDLYYYTCAPEINPTCISDESFKHLVKGEVVTTVLS